MTELIYCLLLLQIKHLICDWLLQPKWMWANKGTYGHFGGVCHALFNGLGTSLVISLFYDNFWLALVLDSFIHYHIDFFKMKLNTELKLKAEKDKEFWFLLGVDQFFHQWTYLVLLILVL